MADTQGQINNYTNELKTIRGEVSHLLMPVSILKHLIFYQKV